MTITGTQDVAGMDSRIYPSLESTDKSSHTKVYPRIQSGDSTSAAQTDAKMSSVSKSLGNSSGGSSSSSLGNYCITRCIGWTVTAIIASLFMITIGSLGALIPLAIVGGVLFAGGALGLGLTLGGIKACCC